jgi:hypothetical protein
MQKIEIPISRIKLILILIGSILFVILGIYLAKNPEDFLSFRHRNPEIIRIVGVFSACFFGLIGFYVVIKLFDNKPGLILDEIGITDNSSAIAYGLIFWKDIVSIRTEKIQTTQFLIIEVNNPEEYIKNSSKFKKLLFKTNFKIYGTPLSINASGLKTNFKKLEALIQTEFEKHKHKQE